MSPKIELSRSLSTSSSSGRFGSLYHGTCDGEPSAVRVLPVAGGDDAARANNAVSLANHLQHVLCGTPGGVPRLIRYVACVAKPREVWLISPFMSCGSVRDRRVAGPVEEHVIAQILAGALLGLLSLHHIGIAHGNIKASNIFVDADGEVWLGDYGTHLAGAHNGVVGHPLSCPYWSAPELLGVPRGQQQQQQPHTKVEFASDVWSLGITAIELAMGVPAYSDFAPDKAANLLRDHAPPHIRGKWSPNFKAFIATCLVKAPEKRASCESLLAHPFIAHSSVAQREMASLFSVPRGDAERPVRTTVEPPPSPAAAAKLLRKASAAGASASVNATHRTSTASGDGPKEAHAKPRHARVGSSGHANATPRPRVDEPSVIQKVLAPSLRCLIEEQVVAHGAQGVDHLMRLQEALRALDKALPTFGEQWVAVALDQMRQSHVAAVRDAVSGVNSAPPPPQGTIDPKDIESYLYAKWQNACQQTMDRVGS